MTDRWRASGAFYRRIAFVALVFLLVNLIGLDRSPIVWVDEVTNNDPALQLVHHGKFISSVFAEKEGFDDSFFWIPPVQPLMTAAVYSLVGFGIWQTRLPLLLCAAIVVFLVGVVAYRTTQSPRVATIATILFALDPLFIQMARAARMDALALLFLLAALALVLGEKSSNRSRSSQSFLAGLFTSLAVLTNPVAAMCAASLFVIGGLRAKPKIRFILAFLCGAVVPIAVWLLVALGSGDAFRVQFVSHVESHFPQGNIVVRVFEEFVRYADSYKRAPLLLLLYLSGMLVMMKRFGFDFGAKLVMCLLPLTHFIFSAMLLSKSVGFYPLYATCFLSIGAGAIGLRAIDWLRTTAGEYTGKFLAVAFFISLVIGGVGGRLLVVLAQWNERDYQQLETGLSSLLTSGDVVCGPPEVWYACVHAGAQLRLATQPDPLKHDFFITKSKSEADTAAFTFIRSIGTAMPDVLPNFIPQSADYRMHVFHSRFRATQKR